MAQTLSHRPRGLSSGLCWGMHTVFLDMSSTDSWKQWKWKRGMLNVNLTPGWRCHNADEHARHAAWQDERGNLPQRDHIYAALWRFVRNQRSCWDKNTALQTMTWILKMRSCNEKCFFMLTFSISMTRGPIVRLLRILAARNNCSFLAVKIVKTVKADITLNLMGLESG